jgi:hypothetical protein
MLTSIIEATRAHYAALQHKPSPDRVALDYEVPGHTAGTIWVKAPTHTLRQSNLTRLRVRLTAMFPEAHTISVGFRDSLNGVGPPTVHNWKPEVLNAPKGLWKSNYGRFNGEGV